MLESPRFIENDNYDGTRAFTWLADLCGLSVDLINFLICQISAIFLATLFRSILHPSKVSPAVRHIFALTVGLAFGYFVFGQQAIHIAGLPTLCYIVIRTQSPKVVHCNVMIVAMSYLLSIQLLRQIYDDGSYNLDVTAPLMIITQKVTSLAFSIHDGFVRQTKDLTKAQQYHAVNKIPTALEFFSYVLHFQGIMAGPLVFYNDYIDFIEGYNLLKGPAKNGTLDNGKSQVVIEPSPTKAVVKKVIGSMICAFIFMKLVKMYPVKNMKEEDFINGTSMSYKFWYAMMATTCIRFKFYHAWLLADATCNNSGLGFTGYDKDGDPKWDLLSNINVLGFEFATNMRDAINNWNIGTTRWLRMIVYERVPKKYGTVLTFALSALWHGFYPGYYLTFATGACMVTAGRMARRMFRHRFQATQFTRMFYDILTCLTTRLVMGYATFPFVLLEFKGSVRLYLKLYLCLHIAAIVTTFILPKFIRGERRSTARSSLATTNATETKVEQNNKEHSIECSNDTINNAHDNKNNKLLLENNENYKKTIKPHNINDNNHIDNDIGDIKLKDDLKTTPKINDIFDHNYCNESLSSITSIDDVLNVPHDQCEMDQLSSKLKEKIDAEAKNIEEFIDKTVTETVSGIVEFKNDLMRDIEYPAILTSSSDGLRKRNLNNYNSNNNNNNGNANTTGNDCPNGNLSALSNVTNQNSGSSVSLEESAAFLKKEIEAVVQQANVLPAVLSNGHAK